MPMPGAATTSALVVSIASLSGWCVWQKNCIQDGLVAPAYPQATEVTPMGVETDAAQDWTSAEANRNFEAAVRVAQESILSSPSAAEDVVADEIIQSPSSPSTAEGKAGTAEQLYTMMAPTLDQSRFSGVSKIESSLNLDAEALKSKTPIGIHDGLSSLIKKNLSSLIVKMETLMTPREQLSTVKQFGILSSIEAMVSPLKFDMETLEANTLTLRADVAGTAQEITTSMPSFLTSFLGLAVVIDLLLAGFAVSLCRRFRSKAGRTDSKPSSMTASILRPTLARVPAPSPHQASEPTFGNPFSVAGTIIRPTFAMAKEPTPQECSWPAEETSCPWPTEETTCRSQTVVIRPVFAQALAPKPQEAPEFPKAAPDAAAPMPQKKTDIVEPSATTPSKPVPVAAARNPLQAQIDAIMDSHIQRKQIKASPAKILQAQIDAIDRKHSKDSEPRKQPFIVPCSSDRDLKEQINAIVGKHIGAHIGAALSEPAVKSGNELKAQINAIVDSRAKSRKHLEQSPAPWSSDDDLKSQINSIVDAHAARCKQSEEPKPPTWSPGTKTADGLQTQINAIVAARKAGCSGLQTAPGLTEVLDDDLKVQINAIVSTRAEYRKQSEELSFQLRAAVALDAAQERRPAAETAIPSPSPAKELSNVELAYMANCALSAAKVRNGNTPAKSPAPVADWEQYHEEEVTPCQLNFADDTVAVEMAETVLATEPVVLSTEPVAPLERATPVPIAVDPKESEKAETRQFDIREIPSPTRNRAKRQQQQELAAMQAQNEENREEVGKPQVVSWPGWEEPTSTHMEASPPAIDKTWKLNDVQKLNSTRIEASPPAIDKTWKLGGVHKLKEASPPATDKSWMLRASATPQEPLPKRKDPCASPSIKSIHGGAVFRMLRNSATPQREPKSSPSPMQAGRRSPMPPGLTTQQEQDTAARRTAAFEAWGVPCHSPVGLKWQ